MTELFVWLDALPAGLFNLYVSVFAFVVWVATFFFERNQSAERARLDRGVGASGNCSVCGVLRQPVLVELDAESAERLVDAAGFEQPGIAVRRESISA